MWVVEYEELRRGFGDKVRAYTDFFMHHLPERTIETHLDPSKVIVTIDGVVFTFEPGSYIDFDRITTALRDQDRTRRYAEELLEQEQRQLDLEKAERWKFEMKAIHGHVNQCIRTEDSIILYFDTGVAVVITGDNLNVDIQA